PDAARLDQYDLIVNTSRVRIDDVVSSIVQLFRDPEGGLESPGGGPRVLTLSRELGAGDTGFAPTLASRLGMCAHDRGLLERQALRLGVSEEELEKIDEQPPGLFQRLMPGSLYHRYLNVVGQLMKELAGRGNVILVGRGGSRLLADQPGAFHVRLIAAPEGRVRRGIGDPRRGGGGGRPVVDEARAPAHRLFLEALGRGCG